MSPPSMQETLIMCLKGGGGEMAGRLADGREPAQ